MKVSILSGAYGNAGDELIEYRCKRLIESVFGIGTVKVYSRKYVKENTALINQSDLVVFSGGPIYQRDISKNFEIADILSIKPPVAIVGGGWKGISRCLTSPYKYLFQENTFQLLKKINENHGLGCRDLYSLKALRNSGFKSAVMTGCPAWYDLEKIHDTVLIDNNWNIRNIYVSDPADPNNYDLAMLLINKLHEMFGNANISFIFHRNKTSESEKELMHKLENFDFVKVKRLTQGADSFKIYRNCDLHIGFRVHAHIYNLSQRKKTILIEEDGRGAGVNEILGIPSLLAYNDEIQLCYGGDNISDKIRARLIRNICEHKNSYFNKCLEDYIDMMKQSQGMYYENAFRLMENYYLNMDSYLNELKNIVTNV